MPMSSPMMNRILGFVPAVAGAQVLPPSPARPPGQVSPSLRRRGLRPPPRRSSPTPGQLGQLSQPGSPPYGIEHSNDGLITFPGGLPIVDEDGVLVGAIGVSGSSVENDHAVAEAGVKVLGVSELPEHPWRT